MTSYKFYTDANRPVLEGKNIFIPDEYALDYQCPEDVTRTFSPLTSFVFGTIELWFSIPLKQLLYIEGYISVQSWKSAEIFPPEKPQQSVVMIDSEENFQRGVSIKLMDDKQAKRTWNPSTGWLCIGPTDLPVQSESIEFAKDSFVVLEKNQIHSLWLQISNFQEL